MPAKITSGLMAAFSAAGIACLLGSARFGLLVRESDRLVSAAAMD